MSHTCIIACIDVYIGVDCREPSYLQRVVENYYQGVTVVPASICQGQLAAANNYGRPVVIA